MKCVWEGRKYFLSTITVYTSINVGKHVIMSVARSDSVRSLDRVNKSCGSFTVYAKLKICDFMQK